MENIFPTDQDTRDATLGADTNIFSPTSSETTVGGLKIEAPKVNDEVLQAQAARYDIALGDSSKGYDDTLKSLRSGNEETIRATAQLARNTALSKRQTGMVKSLIKESADTGTPFDHRAAQLISTLSQPDFDRLDAQESSEERGVVLEEMYADRILNTLLADASTTQDALLEDAEEALKTFDFSSNVLTIQEIAIKKLAELTEKVSNTGMPTKAIDFGEGLLPGASWWNLRDAFEVSDDKNSIFTGGNLAAQAELLYTMTPRQALAAIDKVLSERSADNIWDAVAWMSAMVEYSRDDEMLDNVFSMLDAGDALSLGGTALIGKLAKVAVATNNVANLTLKKATKQIIKNNKVSSSGGGVASVVESAATDVAIDTGATIRALEMTMGAKNISASTVGRLKAVAGNAMSLFNPGSFFRGQTRMSSGRAALMVELQKTSVKLFDVVADVARVDRLGTSVDAGQESSALLEAFRSTRTLLDEEYNVNNNIMDSNWVLPQESIDSVGKIQATVGRSGGLAFKSESGAKGAATRYGLLDDSYEIKELNGGGFGIKIEFDVKENGISTIEALNTAQNNNPQGLAQMGLRFFGGSKEVLSDGSNAQRLKATTGTQRIRRIVQESVKEIGTLSKKEHSRLSRTIAHNRATRDKDGAKGKFFDTVDKFEDYYNKTFNRLPSEKETLAYFKLQQLSDFDYLLRDLSIYRDMALVGTRRYSTKLKNAAGEAFDTEVFNGIKITSLPKYDNKTNYSIIINDGKTTKAVRFKALTPAQLAKIQKGMNDKTMTMVQVYDPNNTKAFKTVDGVEDSLVSVVVTTNQKNGPLRLGNLPYKHGGHHDTAQNWSVKQRDMNKGSYRGDKSIFALDSKAQADKIGTALNKLRLMLKDSPGHKITQEIKDFAEANLPMSAKKARALFYGGRRQFDPNEEFLTTQKGQRTTDVKDFGSFNNDLESPHNPAYWTNRQYTQERQEGLVQTITEEAGVMTALPVELVDPLTSITRGIQQITEAGLLNDLKYYEGTNFVRQFGHLLNNKGTNPIAGILNPQWKSNANPQELAAAQTMHKHLLNILGQRSPEARWQDALALKLENYMFNTPGIGGQIVGNLGMLLTKDPTVWMRKVAFHSKLGFFNPVQILVQGQGVINVMAFAPKYGAQGGMAALLSTRLRMSNGSDSILRKVASFSKGQTAGEFEEAHRQMERRGFNLIENANALIDDVADQALFETKTGKFFDAGRVFFDEGEKFVRTTAWHTAALEYRRTNPGILLLKEGDCAKIGNRADDLSANMLRNSNSRAQSNMLFTLPMQFFTYQQRLAELFLGRRMTTQQKMTALAVYSGVYGVPTAGAAALGGLPLYEMLKSYAADKGESLDDNAIHSMLSGGALKAALQLMTGEKYAVSERLGPGGVLAFKELADGGGLVDFFGGASLSIAKDIYKNASPIGWYLDGLASPDSEVSYKISADDWINLATNISSVNFVQKIIVANQTHKYITRSGTVVGELNTRTDRILHAIGISKQATSDVWPKLDILAGDRDNLASASRNISRMIKRATSLANNGQAIEAHKAFRNVQGMVEMYGLNATQYMKIYRQVLQQRDPLVDQVNRSFYESKNATPETRALRQQLQEGDK